jgi:hypothetical protein
MKRAQVWALFVIAILFLSACGSSAPTQLPAPTATVSASNQQGGITDTSVRIVQEQGSGAVCTANSTYFVYVDITSDGPATAEYVIDATDASGQVPDGVFDSDNSPEVRGSLTFKAAGTQSISLRLVGPYSYPDTITIRAQVNDGDWHQAHVVCK